VSPNSAGRSFLLLCDLAWLRVRKQWRALPADPRAQGQVVMMAIMLCFLAVIQHMMARAAFQLADVGAEGVAIGSPEGVLSVFLLLGAAFGLMTGVNRAVDVLYLRMDLDWTMVLPLERRGIMLARLAEVSLAVAGPVAFLSVPSMVAYAVTYRALYALVLWPLSLGAVSAAGGVVAVLLASATAGVGRSTRSRETWGLIASIAGALIWVLFMSRTSQGPGGMIDLLAQGIVTAMGRPGVGIVAMIALPFTWPALAMRLVACGYVAAGVGVAAVAAGASATAVWLTALACGRAYVRGLGRVSAGRRRLQPSRVARLATGTGVALQAGRTGLIRALVVRDWAILSRSPRLWQPMAMPIAWVGFTAMSLRARMPQGADLLMVGLVGSVAAALSSSVLSALAFGAEGQSFYHLATLPVSPLRRVVSKVAVFSLPPAVLGIAAAVMMQWGRGGLGDYLLAAIVAITASVTLSAVGMLLSIGDTDFAAQNPGQMRPGPAGCMGMLVTALVVGSGFGFLMMVRGLGKWFGMALVAADALGVVLLAGVCLGAVVPAVMRNAADVVRARERGEKPPSWGE